MEDDMSGSGLADKPKVEEDRLSGARSQGQAQFESIAEMVARYQAATDDDAFQDQAEELAKEAGYSIVEDPDQEGMWLWRAKDGRGSDESYSDEEEAWKACCEDNDLRPDEDEARQTIEEDALSVEVRSDWHSPGDREGQEPGEFNILLCTGGPACRLIGTLDRGQPSDVRLEVQDWFTPWTDYMPVHKDGTVWSGWRDVLFVYCSVFYFGD